MDLLLLSGYKTDEDENDDEKSGHPKISSFAMSEDFSKDINTERKKRKRQENRKIKFERCVPHVLGNWAGHIYINIENPFLELIKSAAQNNLKHLDVTDVFLHSDIHISLSREFYLTLPCIEGFTSSIKKRLSIERSFTLFISTSHLSVLVNEEKTRSFFTFPVVNRNEMMRLVCGVDDCMSKFKLPLYYKNPKFHISVASVRGELKHDLNVSRENEGEVSDDDTTCNNSFVPIIIKQVTCKFGSVKYYTIPLVN